MNLVLLSLIYRKTDVQWNYLPTGTVAQQVKNPPAMWEAWVWSLGWEDPLEKGMATHSSILAWRIPWREEPGGLQSMGSQRVGHNWTTFTSFHIITSKKRKEKKKKKARTPIHSVWFQRPHSFHNVPRLSSRDGLSSCRSEGPMQCRHGNTTSLHPQDGVFSGKHLGAHSRQFI